MAVNLRVSSIPSAFGESSTTASVTVPGDICNTLRVHGEVEFIEYLAEKLAAKFVEENYAALLASLNPVAISNLAIAKAAGMVAESFAPKKEERR